MSTKYEYQIAFRGDIIRTITTVHPEIHVVAGYPNATGSIKVLTWYKTDRSAINDVKQRVDTSERNDHAIHSGFVFPAAPGLVEMSAAPIVYSSQRLSGREPSVVKA